MRQPRPESHPVQPPWAGRPGSMPPGVLSDVIAQNTTAGLPLSQNSSDLAGPDVTGSGATAALMTGEAAGTHGSYHPGIPSASLVSLGCDALALTSQDTSALRHQTRSGGVASGDAVIEGRSGSSGGGHGRGIEAAGTAQGRIPRIESSASLGGGSGIIRHRSAIKVSSSSRLSPSEGRKSQPLLDSVGGDEIPVLLRTASHTFRRSSSHASPCKSLITSGGILLAQRPSSANAPPDAGLTSAAAAVADGPSQPSSRNQSKEVDARAALSPDRDTDPGTMIVLENGTEAAARMSSRTSSALRLSHGLAAGSGSNGGESAGSIGSLMSNIAGRSTGGSLRTSIPVVSVSVPWSHSLHTSSVSSHLASEV